MKKNEELFKQVCKTLETGKSYAETSRITGAKYGTVRRWAREIGVKPPRKFKNNDENFAKIISESYSLAEALRKCDLKPRGGNYRIIKKRIKELDLDISHFTGCGHAKGKKNSYAKEIPIEKSFVKDGSLSSSSLNKKIRKYNLKPYICEKCGNKGEHMGKSLSLHLDHINGINNDNRLENLRFLCPNCHSQTSTYCGKSKKKDKKEPVSKKEKKFTPIKPRNKCSGCGKNIDPKAKKCKRCAGKDRPTKIKWPSPEKMKELVWEKPTIQISKELGISDSAIGKFCRNNNIEKPPRGYWTKKKINK